MSKRAIPLEQAKALQFLHPENRPPHGAVIDQGPPELFARAIVQQETIGVMHLGAPIALCLRAFAKPEHRSQRRDPDLLGRVTEVELGPDIDHGFIARGQDELISSRD